MRIKSRTSFKTACLLVRAAIKKIQKILLSMLSKVEIWGLGIRGVLIIDDRAGEVGVVRGVGFGVRVALGEFRG